MGTGLVGGSVVDLDDLDAARRAALDEHLRLAHGEVRGDERDQRRIALPSTGGAFTRASWLPSSSATSSSTRELGLTFTRSVRMTREPTRERVRHGDPGV